VHRDVTPHNVLLSFEGAIKLTDFGIAKAGSTQTAPGILKGKFAYMSPEQARGDRVDARSDVFAMGIVLWELLTGGRLFEADSEVGVLKAVQTATIVAPARLNPQIPEALSDIVMKALARPLEERFQSALELERALAMFVLGTAKSPDDTSTSRFMQEMFRQEYDAVHHVPAALDELAHGPTLAVARHQVAAADEHTTPALDPAGMSLAADEFKSTEELPAVRAVSPSGRLQPGPPAQKPRSDLKATRASRKLPIAENAAATLPDSEPRRGWSAAVGVLAVVVAMAGAAWLARDQPAPVVATRIEAAPPPVAVMPPEPAPAEVIAAAAPAVVEPPVAEAVVLIDAGPPIVAAGARAPPMGVVELRAVPYATLTVDGRESGEVQGSRRLRLSAGTHELVLTHPQLTKRERVVVKGGQTSAISFDALAK